MAEKRVWLEPGKFCCSVCLELPKEPVTISCGHSFCLSCIRTCWDEAAQTGPYSCPQCRKQFRKKPALVKNFMLAELVEDLKKTGDVCCDSCTEKNVKAVKSCLDCLASYCEKHVKPHKESPAFKHHELIGPSENLQENICPLHREVMKIFCRTDQLCICYLCLMEQHKGHETVSAAAERAERQKKLEASREQIHRNIQSAEESFKKLQKAADEFNVSVDKVVEHNVRLYSEQISLLQRRSSEMQQKLRTQQEAGMSPVREHQEKLQQEIRELRKTAAQLEELWKSADHSKFLKEFSSVSGFIESLDNLLIESLSHNAAGIVSQLISHTQQIEKQRVSDPKTSPRVLQVNPPGSKPAALGPAVLPAALPVSASLLAALPVWKSTPGAAGQTQLLVPARPLPPTGSALRTSASPP